MSPAPKLDDAMFQVSKKDLDEPEEGMIEGWTGRDGRPGRSGQQ